MAGVGGEEVDRGGDLPAHADFAWIARPWRDLVGEKVVLVAEGQREDPQVAALLANLEQGVDRLPAHRAQVGHAALDLDAQVLAAVAAEQGAGPLPRRGTRRRVGGDAVDDAAGLAAGLDHRRDDRDRIHPRVEGHHEVADRRFDARREGDLAPEGTGQPQVADAPDPLQQGLNEGRRAVGRAVIDENDFPEAMRFRDRAIQLGDEVVEDRAVLVQGDDDADDGVGIHGRERILNFECWILDGECGIRDLGWGNPDVGCWMVDNEFWMGLIGRCF